jgi:hypothetical protein
VSPKQSHEEVAPPNSTTLLIAGSNAIAAP